MEHQKVVAEARKKMRVIIAKFRNKLPAENPDQEECRHMWQLVKEQTKMVTTLHHQLQTWFQHQERIGRSRN